VEVSFRFAVDLHRRRTLVRYNPYQQKKKN